MSKKKVIVRTRTDIGTESIVPQYPKELTVVNFPPFDASRTVDIQMHEFLLKFCIGRDGEIDQFFIPVSLTEDYLNFTGIQLALHIRLTQELGSLRYLPIVLMGYEGKEEICGYSNLGFFLFSEGVYLIKEDNEEIQAMASKPLRGCPQASLAKEMQSKVIIEPPEFYDNRHNVANDWSLIFLDRISGHNKLEKEQTLQETKSNLYVKWLLVKEEINLPKNEKSKFTFRGVKNKRVLLIDDEWEKGWLELFDVLFQDGEDEGAELDCMEIRKGDDLATLLVKLDEKLAENWDLFLLDVRLTDADHNDSLPHQEYSGFKLLERIKENNPGNQVLLISASDKKWIYDYGKSLGANEIIVKPDFHNPERHFILEEFSKAIQRSFDKGFLKPIYQSVLEIENSFQFSKKGNGFEVDELIALENEIKKLFHLAVDVLSMGKSNSYEYSTITLFKVLELVKNYFIIESPVDSQVLVFKDDSKEVKYFIWEKGEYSSVDISPAMPLNLNYYKSTENQFRAFCFQKLNLGNDQKKIHRTIHDITRYRNNFIHPNSRKKLRDLRPLDFVKWFSHLAQVFKSY